MALKPDFENVLTVFVYLNLPVLMNPGNAINIVVSAVPIPTPPTTATGTIQTLVISPDLLLALQTASLNSFTDLGLPKDIEEIAKNFFALLSPVISVTATSTVVSSAATTQ
ncbi:MAG TPA: hypothetical protein PKA28_05445 [Methylomusa anaerophila]|uniref:Uncharacterized protein n=1 Tax=Methylomusa anaerophila TaxID=1930071 RepID=A0A348AM12_9FIRM|nr:hypothetical protein [Methylomusa anaerophila]BBB92110.1 hypothetical protein MAMMFC1_02795 [Methylomusa anaerophila]HML87876.1 hypothetical protein [Methylomusa anaerophila]